VDNDEDDVDDDVDDVVVAVVVSGGVVVVVVVVAFDFSLLFVVVTKLTCNCVWACFVVFRDVFCLSFLFVVFQL